MIVSIINETNENMPRVSQKIGNLNREMDIIKRTKWKF